MGFALDKSTAVPVSSTGWWGSPLSLSLFPWGAGEPVLNVNHTAPALLSSCPLPSTRQRIRGISKPHLCLQSSPGSTRPRWLAGTEHPWKSLHQTWESSPWNDLFGGQAASQSKAKYLPGRTLQAKIYGEKKRSLRSGFETRLTWFFRSAVASTALFLPGELLGAQLF